MRVKTALMTLCLIAGLLPLASQARSAKDFPDYVIHYSAFTADTLPASVAQKYDIQRSSNRGIVNIVVMRKEGDKTVAVEADVRGTAVNRNEQLRRLHPREIKDGDATYYLAEFPVSNREQLDFTIDVTPKGTSKTLQVQFEQQFFTRPPPE